MPERYRTTVFSIVLALSVTGTSVSSAILTSSASTRKLAVGDRIRFTVNIIAPKGATVTPPPTEEGFGSVLVKEWNVQKVEREKSDSIFYDYLLTTYNPEPCTIPRLPFVLVQGDAVDTLFSDVIPLQVISVLPSDTVDIMELKPPLSAGKAPRWWLWLLGITGAVAAVTFAAVYLTKRLRKVPPPPPPVPPYEEAIDALVTLGARKYLERGLIREYVFELSEIFKRYIGRRFECNGVEFTTEEMISWSGATALPKKQRTAIEWFFRATDPVKFARLIPDFATIERFDREVRDFLEATRPVTLETDESDEAKATSTQPAETEQGGREENE